jgi:hypothetical protein
MMHIAFFVNQLSIGSGAKNDLTRHAKSQNHMQLEMVQRKSKSMSLFVATPNNSLKSKTTSTETQFCNFIAEHNIPFAVADHITSHNYVKKCSPTVKLSKDFLVGELRPHKFLKELLHRV